MSESNQPCSTCRLYVCEPTKVGDKSFHSHGPNMEFCHGHPGDCKPLGGRENVIDGSKFFQPRTGKGCETCHNPSHAGPKGGPCDGKHWRCGHSPENCAPKSSPASPVCGECGKERCHRDPKNETNHAVAALHVLRCEGCHGHASPQAKSGEGWEASLTSYPCCFGRINPEHDKDAPRHYIITDADIEKVKSFISRLIKERDEKVLGRAEKAVVGLGKRFDARYDHWVIEYDKALEAIRSLRGEE